MKNIIGKILNISYLKYCEEIKKTDKPLIITDLGCGNGELLHELSKKFPKNNYFGIDLYIENNKQVNIELIQDDLIKYTKKEKFLESDIVIMNDVLEHLSLSEIFELFENFKKIKKEAIIFIQSPNCSSPFGLRNQSGDITHKISLSPYRVENIIKKSKFKCSYNIFGVDEINKRLGKITGIITAIIYYKFLCKILNVILMHSIGWNNFFWNPNFLIKIKNENEQTNKT